MRTPAVTRLLPRRIMIQWGSRVDKSRTTTAEDPAAPLVTHLEPKVHRAQGPSSLKLPDFVIIGAARCGTTTLYEYLKRHPDIFMCTPKEPGFFALEQEYAKGFDYYASLFKGATRNQLRGEASTHYTSFPCPELAARRLRAANPEAKLIYVLRQPVDRLFSHYIQETKASLWLNPSATDIGEIPLDADGCYVVPQEHRRPWRIAPTFEKSLEICPDFLLRTSNYMETIRAYLQYFPRDALLVLLLEDLGSDPDATLTRIYDFLGVTRIETPDRIVANAIDADAPEGYWRARFKVWLANKIGIGSESIDRATGLLPAGIRRFVADALLKPVIRDRDQPELNSLPKKIDPELRANLLERFCQSNQELGLFLGRDLSHWNS